MTRRGGMDAKQLASDIGDALEGAERGWPARMDTLCCGTLGSIEFFCEAGKILERGDLRELASRRLWRLWNMPPRPATTDGTAANGNSIWASFAASPASAIHFCGKQMRRCLTSWFGNSLPAARSYFDFAVAHDATTAALNMSKDWTATVQFADGSAATAMGCPGKRPCCLPLISSVTLSLPGEPTNPMVR